MFKSKLRPVVIPQSEHGRLAGAIASLWGNDQFERPAVDLKSFVLGVGLHDRGYGFIDNLPLGEMDESTWLQVVRKGFYTEFKDPAADLIVKYHLKRLVAGQQSPDRNQMAAEFDRTIDRQAESNGLSRVEFGRVDRITDFCDSIAFNFCFERPTSGSVAVFPRNGREDDIELGYSIESGGIIRIRPWPLSLDLYSGYLVGYEQEGYPGRLEPVMVPFTLSRH